MDRLMVYPGAIPLDTDVLSVERNVMKALGWLAQATLGTGTGVAGLACTPSVPASMTVNIGPGALWAQEVMDQSNFGSLPADNSPLMKMGILPEAGGTNFTLSAPSTSGQSINYLIEAAFAETDTNPIVLPYVNPANPSQPFTGPNNSGTAQNTIRSQSVALQLKAGVAANTGTQINPSVDAGYVGLYVITVNFGQTTITAANISQFAGAPFNAPPFAALAGNANQPFAIGPATNPTQAPQLQQVSSAISTAISGIAEEAWVEDNYLPLTGGTLNGQLTIEAQGGSTTPLVISAPNDNNGAGILLQGDGASAPNKTIRAQAGTFQVLNSDYTAPVLEIDDNGNMSAVNSISLSSPAISPTQTPQFGQLVGRLLNIQVFTQSGTYTPTPGTNSIVVGLQASGGGSGAVPPTTSSLSGITACGGCGGFAWARYTAGFSSGLPVTIGEGGSGGSSVNWNGSQGGLTSFGSFLSAIGGFGSNFGVSMPDVFNIVPALPGPAPVGTGILYSSLGNYGLNTLQAKVGYDTGGSFVSSTLGGAEYGFGAEGPYNGFNAPFQNGMSGGNGLIIVYEYS